MNEAPDHAADHLPEEMGGREADEDEGSVGLYFGSLDDDQGARLLGGPFAEEAVVVLAHQERGGFGHAAVVEGTLDPPDPALGEGRAAAGDLVEVGPQDGVVTGVEAVRS